MHKYTADGAQTIVEDSTKNSVRYRMSTFQYGSADERYLHLCTFMYLASNIGQWY